MPVQRKPAKKVAAKKAASKKGPASKAASSKRSASKTNPPDNTKAGAPETTDWSRRVAKLGKRGAGPVDSIRVRMYRAGTGDCFFLQYRSKGDVTMNMLIDCGCIQGGRADMIPWLEDLWQETSGTIDVLVVTHQHADHINGFQFCREEFDRFRFQRVWFAWTEDEEDAFANELREHHSAINLALQEAGQRFQQLTQNNYFETQFQGVYNGRYLAKSKRRFMQAFEDINSLNLPVSTETKGNVPSMVQLFRNFNVIKNDTLVEFFSPGDLVKNLPGAEGIRFFILGPPRDTELLSETEGGEENFEKREEKSTRDFAFSLALTGSKTDPERLPFEHLYEWVVTPPQASRNVTGLAAATGKTPSSLKEEYQKKPWQQIDHDWLLSAGSMALRYEGSINNTSLAMAIQFEESERVLLFPGDAEWGNWKSWHEGLTWRIRSGGSTKTVNAEYLLNNTVFYKIGHHFSQNGSATRLGVEMMIHEDMAAMAPLNFTKIHTGWLNTMPNDLLGATLLAKAKGKLFFSGDCQKIFENIKTDRVHIKKAYETEMVALNRVFDGKCFIDYVVEGSA